MGFKIKQKVYKVTPVTLVHLSYTGRACWRRLRTKFEINKEISPSAHEWNRLEVVHGSGC